MRGIRTVGHGGAWCAMWRTGCISNRPPPSFSSSGEQRSRVGTSDTRRACPASGRTRCVPVVASRVQRGKGPSNWGASARTGSTATCGLGGMALRTWRRRRGDGSDTAGPPEFSGRQPSYGEGSMRRRGPGQDDHSLHSAPPPADYAWVPRWISFFPWRGRRGRLGHGAAPCRAAALRGRPVCRSLVAGNAWPDESGGPAPPQTCARACGGSMLLDRFPRRCTRLVSSLRSVHRLDWTSITLNSRDRRYSTVATTRCPA